MKKVSMKTKAWMTEHCDVTPKELTTGKRLDSLAFNSNIDMCNYGWTLVGGATITVSLIEEKKIFENKVVALRNEMKNIRAEATAKCTRIEGQIQSLLAIDFDGKKQAA